MLPAIISREQGAFVEGRSISDNILLATELHHSILNARSDAPSFMLKLDMAKAFDRVSWDFIEQVLVFLGFPTVWTHWALGAIRQPTFLFFSISMVCSHPWFTALWVFARGVLSRPFFLSFALRFSPDYS